MFLGGRRRQTGALLAVCLLALFVCAAFVFSHADHEHDHHGPQGSCAACAQLHSAKNLLDAVVAATLVSAALHALFIATSIVCASPDSAEAPTLISLKVRLNN